VNIEKEDRARFLVMMAMGIGDAVAVGLSAIDQIIKNEPEADGKIDVVCNDLQADLFKYDPRIHSIICIDDSIFPALDISSLDRGIVLKPEAIKLIQLLRSKHYDGVFPGNTTPFFYLRLRAPIMEIGVRNLFRNYLSLRFQNDIHVSQITRRAVNTFFGNRLPEPAVDEEIPLYITSHHIQKAITVIESMKDQANVKGKPCQVVMVAPDTSSFVTRPPTKLLAGGIAGALHRKHHLAIYILPGYTDRNAAQNLYESLSPDFSGRILMIPHEPPLSLLETTAFIDQAEIFITGDTGTMHLAVAVKKLREEDSAYSPRNSGKVIVLFGGTNPGVHGYSQQTIILGRGRKEQSAVVPGIFKEAYNGKQRNFFDHIIPPQLTNAIISQLEVE
jgi:ADP-heptose:LPS heptosyltransferase